MTYRYRLQGEDADWQNAGSRRQAFYTRLRPGKYTFEVSAREGQGSWVNLQAPLRIDVLPTFYQTYWFDSFVLLLLCLIIFAAYILRLRQVTGRIQLLSEERSRERTKIARELHDTLLQSIHGLMLRFHFAVAALPEDEPARQSLQVALSRADDVIVEGRRQVQDLREEVPDATDFTSVLAEVGQELEVQKAMRFEVKEEGKPQELNPVIRSELRKIAREALRNTLQHSGATSTVIALSYASLEFVMRLSDNGVGISPLILNQGKRHGHWGLVGMRERAAAIHGKMQVWSSSDEGTEIEVRIPANDAYCYPRFHIRLLHLLSHNRRNAKD